MCGCLHLIVKQHVFYADQDGHPWEIRWRGSAGPRPDSVLRGQDGLAEGCAGGAGMQADVGGASSALMPATAPSGIWARGPARSVARSRNRAVLVAFPGCGAGGPPAAFAVLSRGQVRMIHGGNALWRRLDILTAGGGVPRSYTMMISGLGGGRKRLQRLIGELESG